MLILYTILLLCLYKTTIIHNHAHSSEPLLLLVSFDGFRWDYLNNHNLTNFNYLKQNGVYADYIYNAYATITFPNHWTIVTGLYEETHGIIQNSMYDPILNAKYDPNIVDSLSDFKWYAQNNITEPIWATNQKHNGYRYSAAEWIGSDVVIHDQAIISIPYNRTRSYKDIVDQFIQLFTRKEKPINFGAMYFDEPDHTGHEFGPYSKEIAEKLVFCDDTLGYLIQQLKEHHLFDNINIIVTSDHGMEEISEKNTRFLDQFVNTDLFEAYGSRSLFNIFVKNDSDLEIVYKNLSQIPNLFTYYKNDLPTELHYKNNPRVGEIIVVAEVGHSIYIKTQNVDWNTSHGDHGFFNNQSSMYPIFIAHGPAFKSGGFKINSFHNVDIYPLMCFILGLQPAINNGTLENVIDMLKVKLFEAETNIYFVFLLGIPVTIVCISLICAICINRKRQDSKIQNTNNGYSKLLTDDTIVDFEDEEIFSKESFNNKNY